MLGAGSPPLSGMDKFGKPEGLAVEVWNRWSEVTGVPVRFIFSGWAQTLDAVADGTADIHGGLYFTENRSTFLDFSESYFEAPTVLAIHERSGLDCDNALSQGVVGVLDRGYALDYLLDKVSDAKYRPYPDYNVMVREFLDRKVDAIIVGYVPLAQGAREASLNDYTVCRTLISRKLHAGVAKGNVHLLRLVNEGLTRIPFEEFQRMGKRWRVSYERPLPWMWVVVPVAVVFLLLGAAVMLWAARRD